MNILSHLNRLCAFPTSFQIQIVQLSWQSIGLLARAAVKKLGAHKHVACGWMQPLAAEKQGRSPLHHGARLYLGTPNLSGTSNKMDGDVRSDAISVISRAAHGPVYLPRHLHSGDSGDRDPRGQLYLAAAECRCHAVYLARGVYLPDERSETPGTWMATL